MNRLWFIILLTLGLVGCRTQQVDITEADNIHDTCFITRIVHDSIEMHDSTFCHIYEKADTVFQTLEKWHTKYKERLQHDTVYVSRIDTVTITKTIMQKEQKIPWYHKIFDSILVMILIAIGMAVLVFSVIKK